MEKQPEPPLHLLPPLDFFHKEGSFPEGLSAKQVQKLLADHYYQQYYQAVSQELHGQHRSDKLFVWLGRAIGTVKPDFEPKVLHEKVDRTNFAQYLNILCEAIELFCVVAIMLDDCMERMTSEKDYTEFVNPLYTQVEIYIKQSYLKFRSKKEKTETFKLKAGDSLEIKRENYITAIKYWIDRMFSQLAKLPNFENEAIKDRLFATFQDILVSSRFSHQYDIYLKSGTLEDIKSIAPDTAAYIEHAKGGMGTKCMIPMVAMLLQDGYISKFLDIVPLIDGPGRIANDQATFHEEAIGANANGILHTGLVEGIITLEELRTVTKGTIDALLAKLLSPSDPEQPSPVTAKISEEWETRVAQFYKIVKDMPPELGALSYVNGHLWFLAQELQFCPETIQRIWINSLREKSRENIEYCLGKLGGEQYIAY